MQFSPPVFENYLRNRKKIFENGLVEFLDFTFESSPSTQLAEGVRYAVGAGGNGGKRLRPMIVYAAAEALKLKPAQVLPHALAIELLHNYTLVHDDLPCMDNDSVRRGQPTVHAKYGYSQAVLIGDMLQTLAFKSLGHLSNSAMDAEVEYFDTLFALDILSEAAQSVLEGQWEDLFPGPGRTLDGLFEMHRRKTGALFGAAATLPCTFLEDNLHDCFSRLSKFGKSFGQAFQLLDDLDDEPARREKPADEREASAFEFLSEEEIRAKIKEFQAEALDTLSGFPGDTAPLETLLLAFTSPK